MRTGDRAAQRRRVRQQVDIAAPQPAHLAAAQPRAGHQQHDQPVPRRPAAPQHPERFLIAGPVHPPLRLPQPVPGPQPPCHPPVLTARHLGQVPVIGDLIQQRHQPGRRGPGRHGVHHQPPHRRQHAIDPPLRAGRRMPRTCQHLRPGHHLKTADLRSGMPQPGDEQTELPDAVMPVPAGPRAPPQEQRDAARIRPGRGLRLIAAEPDITQERIRLADHGQVIIEHRPVPRTRRQPHQERPHPHPPDRRARQPQTTTSNDHHTHGHLSHHQPRVAPAQRHATSDRPGEKVRTSRRD